MLHIFLSNRPGEVRYGTTGKPVPGYEMRLVDEDGQPVQQGEIGELQISGPTSAPLYWNNRERSRTTFLGAMDAQRRQVYRETPTATTPIAAAPTTCSRSAASTSRPSRSRRALLTHDGGARSGGRSAQDDEHELVKPKAYVVLKPGVAGDAALAAALQQHVKDAPRALQVPALDRVHRRAAEDGDRQDPALQAARARREIWLMPFVTVKGQRLDYELIAARDEGAPTLILLHEGLGSIAQWRDFPARLAAATGCAVLVYSRLRLRPLGQARAEAPRRLHA